MDKAPNSMVTVGPQGRLVIPAEIRRQMGIGPGDVLLALVEDQRLVLEKREAVLQRLRRRFEHIPADISLADELIAERRSAARAPGRPCRLDDDRATDQDAGLDTEKIGASRSRS